MFLGFIIVILCFMGVMWSLKNELIRYTQDSKRELIKYIQDSKNEYFKFIREMK